MPDARIDLSQTHAETIAPSLEKLASRKPAALQYWFPHLACTLVVGGIGAVTYFMDQASAEGRLTGMPYVLLALLIAAIFVADYFIYKED